MMYVFAIAVFVVTFVFLCFAMMLAKVFLAALDASSWALKKIRKEDDGIFYYREVWPNRDEKLKDEKDDDWLHVN